MHKQRYDIDIVIIRVLTGTIVFY